MSRAHGEEQIIAAITVAQLVTAATAVSDALAERANTKVRRVGATKGIEQAVQLGREAVSMLHAVVSREFTGDATLLAAWHSARRVVVKPGAARTVIGVPVPALAPLTVTAVATPLALANTPAVAVAA